MQTFFFKVQRFATSGRHSSSMIADRRKFTTKIMIPLRNV